MQHMGFFRGQYSVSTQLLEEHYNSVWSWSKLDYLEKHTATQPDDNVRVDNTRQQVS